ncbi:MAG: YcaO-like family protein [Acidimicrobiales bacterium]
MDVITRPPTTDRGPAIVTIADTLHGPHWDAARQLGWGTVRIGLEPGGRLAPAALDRILNGLPWYDGPFILTAMGDKAPLAMAQAAQLGADAVVIMFPPPGIQQRDTHCPVLFLDAAYRDDGPSRDARSNTIHGPWASAEVHTILPECVLGIPDVHLADPARLAIHWFNAGCRGPLPQYFHGEGNWFVPVRRSDQIFDLPPDRPDLVHRAADPYPAVPHSASPPTDRDDVWRWTVPTLIAWFGQARLRIVVAPSNSRIVGTLIHRRSDGVGSVLTDATAEILPSGRCELVFGTAGFAPAHADELVVEVTTTRSPRHPIPNDTTLRLRAARIELPRVRLETPDPWPVYRHDESQVRIAIDDPDQTGADEPPAAGDPSLRTLVDARSGLVTSVEPAPDWVGLPVDVHLLSAQVASLDDHLSWPADRVAMGMGFDETTAFNAAVGEAVERYCGNFVPETLRRASWNQLASAHIRAIHPDDLALFAPGQYAAAHCPFEPLTPELSIEWVAGTDLTDDATTWAPASLVWVNYHLDRREPRTHPHNLAGLAAGRDRGDAERSALEEIIERDSVQIWWLAGLPAAGIVFDPPLLDEDLRSEGNGWYHHDHLPYRIRVLAIPTTWPVPVVGVYLHHLHHDLHVLGLAARPDPLEAVRKGWLEALALQGYARGLLDPDGDVWRSIHSGVFSGAGLKPWRVDRRYRAHYADDYHDLPDLACHSQIWLDPAMRTELGPILAGTHPPIPLTDLEHPITEARSHYLWAMKAKGIRPVSVDVTTPDIAGVGPRVVRIIAPGTYMNTPAGYPLLGGNRLRDDAATLGLDRPLTPETVNLTPLPHT